APPAPGSGHDTGCGPWSLLLTERRERAGLGPAVVGLAARAALHLLDEHDPLRQLVAGDVPGGECTQLLAVDRRAVTQLDDRVDLLPPARIRRADDDRVVHLGMGLQRALDLLGIHLLAAGVDRDRAAPEHRDRAVRGDRRVISGYRVARAAD